MSIELTHDQALTPPEPARTLIHPLWVRLTHWVNAVAMVVMIGSGWEIYNASPLFPFAFPPAITLGGWLAGALLWHFAAMWLLAVNGLIYVVLGVATGRFRRMLVPIRPREVLADTKAALARNLSYDDLSIYNAVQKLLYLGIILVSIVIVLSGLPSGSRCSCRNSPPRLAVIQRPATSTFSPWQQSSPFSSFTSS